MAMVRWLRTAIVTLLMVGLVALNLLTVTVGSVFSALSSIVEALDVDTVKRRHDASLGARDGRIAELTSKRDDLERRRTDLEAERDEVERRRADLEAERNELRRERQRLKARAQELDEKVAASRRTVGNVSSKIGRRMQINAARNIASMPAEAIPIVGVGTIVVVTAAEILDVCWTLEEMEELRRSFDLNPPEEGNSKQVCGIPLPTEGDVRTSAEDRIEADYAQCMRDAYLVRAKEQACRVAKAERLEDMTTTLAYCLQQAGPSRALKEDCLAQHSRGELR